jgi:hypothetical protein
MLGPAKSDRLDQPVTVSLEALVPPGAFSCHLEATLDPSFVRGRVGAWAPRRGGRLSVEPVVFFTLQLIETASLPCPIFGTRATALTSRCLTAPASPAFDRARSFVSLLIETSSDECSKRSVTLTSREAQAAIPRRNWELRRTFVAYDVSH